MPVCFQNLQRHPVVRAWLHICIYLKTESPVFHWLTRKRFIVLQGQYPRDSISPCPARPPLAVRAFFLHPVTQSFPCSQPRTTTFIFRDLRKDPLDHGIQPYTRVRDEMTRLRVLRHRTLKGRVVFFKFQLTNITFTTKGEECMKSNVGVLI